MVAEVAEGDGHVAWRGSAVEGYRTRYRPAYHLPVEAGSPTKRFGEASASGESRGVGVSVRARTGCSRIRTRRSRRWKLSSRSMERCRRGNLEFRNEVEAHKTRQQGRTGSKDAEHRRDSHAGDQYAAGISV